LFRIVLRGRLNLWNRSGVKLETDRMGSVSINHNGQVILVEPKHRRSLLPSDNVDFLLNFVIFVVRLILFVLFKFWEIDGVFRNFVLVSLDDLNLLLGWIVEFYQITIIVKNRASIFIFTWWVCALLNWKLTEILEKNLNAILVQIQLQIVAYWYDSLPLAFVIDLKLNRVFSNRHSMKRMRRCNI